MAEAATKMPVRNEGKPVDRPTEWRPFESCGGKSTGYSRIFNWAPGDCHSGAVCSTSSRSGAGRSARRPLSTSSIPTRPTRSRQSCRGWTRATSTSKFSDGTLMIKGEKRDDKEEKKKGYYLSERRYGAFQRSFGVPDGVDAEKIEANFKNGVLTVTLPKAPQTQRSEKKIAIKSA